MPVEVLIDVLKILFDNKIKHRIDTIRERENCVYLEALIDKRQSLHISAMENISDILDYFGHCLHEGIENEWT